MEKFFVISALVVLVTPIMIYMIFRVAGFAWFKSKHEAMTKLIKHTKGRSDDNY